jgi:hypothetical protein
MIRFLSGRQPRDYPEVCATNPTLSPKPRTITGWFGINRRRRKNVGRFRNGQTGAVVGELNPPRDLLFRSNQLLEADYF